MMLVDMDSMAPCGLRHILPTTDQESTSARIVPPVDAAKTAANGTEREIAWWEGQRFGGTLRGNCGRLVMGKDTTATRRANAGTLLHLMADVAAQPPRMWGPSIIGFGTDRYKYAPGREGDAPAVAFSPRKAYLSVLQADVSPSCHTLTGAAGQVQKLGEFEASAARVYVNNLADVDSGVLRELISMAYNHSTTTDIQSLQSQRS